MERLLLVDDDAELGELLTEYLHPEGFAVEQALDGIVGVGRALVSQPSLVILDVMLPGLGGFQVLRQIRAESVVPILMLTARQEDIDRILGLELGADDYLSKPFNPRELVARIRAVLRRVSQREVPVPSREVPVPSREVPVPSREVPVPSREVPVPSREVPVPSREVPVPSREVLTVGDLTVDVQARTIRRSGATVALTGAEFDILVILLRTFGRVVTREHLVKTVLDRRLMPGDRSIDTHIGNLRRKLGPYPDGSDRVKTLRGVGYLYAPRSDSDERK